MTGGKYRLFEAVLELSESKKWEQAKKEWVLDRIELAETEDIIDGAYSCLCGHTPLKDLCVIRNQLNGKEAIVGNCCVKRFPSLDGTSKAVKALKEGRINKAMADYAFGMNYITEWEYDFLIKVWRKRKLSQKQHKIKMELKEKIVDAISRDQVYYENK